MRITVAKSAGFCFGVARAVEKTRHFISEGQKACTLGPLIHNPGFIDELKQKGIFPVTSLDEVPKDYTLIIRTHGIEKEISDDISSRRLPFADVTCPFVKKIHRIVGDESAQGRLIFIAGDKNHPEVVGIRSYCRTKAFVFSSEEELEDFTKNNIISPDAPVSMVSQTTFSEKEFKKIENFAEKHYTNIKKFATICNATAQRQQEAFLLSQENDMMLIIGGKNSSNTQKLYAICKEHCPSYLIENATELSEINLSGVSSIGVTAGASTPEGIIKEVVKTMSELIDNTVADTVGQAEAIAEPEEMSFEQALEESLNSMNNDQTVKGVVMHIAPNEIQVDIGRKQTGIIPADEYSSDPTADPAKELKVGDELTLIIMKTNDVEGTIMLSKKRYDAVKYWDSIVKAQEEGTVLEGTVVEVISKGLIVFVNGIRVFVPASLSTVPRDGRLEDMLNKTVRFTIVDIDKHRRRAVGSIRDAAKLERKAGREAFWAQVSVGQHYNGTVKSLTDYGAFVELAPGVDGMVHKTELSWKRIKHPSEIVNVGDVVDVYIKALDDEKKKISLGYKKLEDNPWEILKRDYPVGTETTVKIVRMATFGAFAEIFPRMEGLIHISQISYEHIATPNDVLSIGDEVKVKVIGIDTEAKRISLSIKELLPPPEKVQAPKKEEPVEEAPAVYSIDDMIQKANEAEAQAPAEETAE